MFSRVLAKLAFGTIVCAVVVTDIEWDWTPNPYLPVIIGAGLAYGVFWLVSYLRGVSRVRRANIS